MIKKIVPRIIILAVMISIGVYIFNAYRGKPASTRSDRNVMSADKAAESLNRLMVKVDWSENHVQRRANVQLGGAGDLKDTLPDIGQFDLVVNPNRSGDVEVVEIFTSTEKSGKGIDGIMVEVAKDFNARNQRLKSGKIAKVAIRKIASGTGYQFIASGKYLPDAFSPSNLLWVQMASAHGVTMVPVRQRMVGNIAGLVMKEPVAKRLKTNLGALNIKNIINAVVQGNLIMGYTNPFASSTGLNFLVTVLSTFADGDPDAMLSPDVVSSFESFQRGVPFVALTTLQMRDSVEKDGSLEAFVMEYQTFINTSTLKSGYTFIPFGIPHDNPLYGVGNITPDKKETLEHFATFSEKSKYKKLAKQYGFNPSLKYKQTFEIPDGKLLVRAQKVWKEKKDAGRPIAAVFLCDVSGSMRGTRLNKLKIALLEGSEFIANTNLIGIILFNHRVTVVLPIKQFNLVQKASYHAAVEDMFADGKTAMYDGVAISLSLLLEEKKKTPDIKPILFVLTDGETNIGMVYEDLAPVISGLNIPIYTIGYEANIAELNRLSSLVEAASLNAGEGEIEYKIGALLNAQM